MALRVVRRYARDPAEAEDLAQEALVQAWRNQSQLRSRERWKEWLSQIARNVAVRAVGHDLPVPVEELPEVPRRDSRLEGLVEGAELEAALAALSADDREILRLRYVEDLTQPKVAEHLGIKESAAKVRLSRARRKLEVLLTAGGQAPSDSGIKN